MWIRTTVTEYLGDLVCDDSFGFICLCVSAHIRQYVWWIFFVYLHLHCCCWRVNKLREKRREFCREQKVIVIRVCVYCALERHPNLEKKKYSKNEVKWKSNDRLISMANVKMCDCHINKADSHNTKRIKWTVSKGAKWITWKVCEVLLVKCVQRMRLLNAFAVLRTGKTLENSPFKWIIRWGKKRNKTKILFKKRKKTATATPSGVDLKSVVDVVKHACVLYWIQSSGSVCKKAKKCLSKSFDFGFSNAAHRSITRCEPKRLCVCVYAYWRVRLRQSAETSCDKYVWNSIETCITATWYMNCTSENRVLILGSLSLKGAQPIQ